MAKKGKEPSCKGKIEQNIRRNICKPIINLTYATKTQRHEETQRIS
ncbi:MAG: hypothetical protein ABH886_07800 [Candidatus Desantisbacteria bacterium]